MFSGNGVRTVLQFIEAILAEQQDHVLCQMKSILPGGNPQFF
jgi:hypothetical protein